MKDDISPCRNCQLRDDCSEWLLACEDYKHYYFTGKLRKTHRKPNQKIYTLVFGLDERVNFIKEIKPLLLKLLINEKNCIKFLSDKWGLSINTVLSYWRGYDDRRTKSII